MKDSYPDVEDLRVVLHVESEDRDNDIFPVVESSRYNCVFEEEEERRNIMLMVVTQTETGERERKREGTEGRKQKIMVIASVVSLLPLLYT